MDANWLERVIESFETQHTPDVIAALKAQLSAERLKEKQGEAVAQDKLEEHHKGTDEEAVFERTIVLIYQEVPEYLRIYRWETPTGEEAQLLESCHGCYVNSLNDKEYLPSVIDFLNEIGEGKHDDHLIYSDRPESNHKQMPIVEDACTIVVTGFIL